VSQALHEGLHDHPVRVAVLRAQHVEAAVERRDLLSASGYAGAPIATGSATRKVLPHPHLACAA
jgi:hypothetical protein